MTRGALAKKIGMTQIYDDLNRHIPVTILQLYPQVISGVRSTDKDGYNAVQIGAQISKRANKPQREEAKQAKIDLNISHHREVRLSNDESEQEDVKIGQAIDVSLFSLGDKVSATATSKGKGFAGVIKRHHFSRGPETHGSEHHREPGSIGSMYPQHVVKGRRMPGHMGAETVTTRSLVVVAINPDQNTLALKGAVPGPKKGIVFIQSLEK